MTPAGRLVSRIALAATLLAIIAGTAWYCLHKSADTANGQGRGPTRGVPYDGPFQNIHSDVKSVGSATCAECHPDIARTYSQHPMGQSILPVSTQPIGDLAERGQATFQGLGSRFRINRVGERLWYTETRVGPDGPPLFEISADIRYVIGSGSKGHSFLSEHDGYLTQAPISWFSQKRVWAESPGFSPDLHTGRPIQVGCLFCHANEVVPVPGTLNRYETPIFRGGHSIGCERCHGPGAEHVRQRGAGLPIASPDYSIVNPRHLEPARREAVCQQCHLEGEARIERAGRGLSDFRPGLPLDSVLRVLVWDHQGEDRKAVNHVEQMYLSKCFQASGGAIGCTTCHDPHEKPSAPKRDERYRAACLKCHDCPTPIATRTADGVANNCATCHMPRFAADDIVHAASTNHRIVRPSDQSRQSVPAHQTRARPLLFFPIRAPNFRDADEGRDFAIGLVELAKQGRAPPGQVERDGLPLLERAIAASPHDLPAWEAKSYALQLAGRKSEALAAAQTVLASSPDSEAGLTQAATVAAEADQWELSFQYWRKAIELNPTNPAYRQELAAGLAKRGNWQAARVEAEHTIRLSPARAFARTILATALFRAGQKTEGDDQFRIVERLQPPNLNDLRRWYITERSRP